MKKINRPQSIDWYAAVLQNNNIYMSNCSCKINQLVCVSAVQVQVSIYLYCIFKIFIFVVIKSLRMFGTMFWIWFVSYKTVKHKHKFSLITRIILQKHKYDIQIFPNYSWTRLPASRSSSVGPEGHFSFFHPKVKVKKQYP